MSAKRVWYDVAYGSFLCSGLIAVYAAYLIWMSYPVDPKYMFGATQALAMLVLIPFGLPMLVLVPTAVLLSVVLWREWRLWMMSILTIGLLALMNWEWLILNPAPTTIYGIISLLLTVPWFLRDRKRHSFNTKHN